MKIVVILPRAARALRRMPAKTARMLRTKIDQYAMDPPSLANNVVRLHGRSGYRLRVGDWRILFDENGAVLEISDIGPRGGIYR